MADDTEQQREAGTSEEQVRINEEEWANSANWRLGIFYYSARDTRPFVPKRSMFSRRRYGGTPNFAHRSARAYLMVLVGGFLLLLLLLIALRRSGIIN